jgi:small subunit ribosomal protein S7
VQFWSKPMKIRKKRGYKYVYKLSFKKFKREWILFINLLLNNSIKKEYFSKKNSFPLLFFFIDELYTNYTSLLTNQFLISLPLNNNFLQLCCPSITKPLGTFFPTTWPLTMTFFTWLRNNIWQYEMLRWLLFTSFRQQWNIIHNFDVGDMLFWYIIWKGKKLTARRVFLKFLKKFWNKYFLPGLIIFTHAMLLVEPKVWVKKKLIAGWAYEIPIYISPRRSKCIAIWWLLQAAKKRKRASITDSLALEVWDACFKRGVAYANKEAMTQLVKWNKAYLWWL